MERLIAAANAGRHCVRCGADVHPPDPPHLCKDVRGRLNAYRTERRQHLLRLVRGRRCRKHGTALRLVCGVRSCGMCYIEEPFRVRRGQFPVWDGTLPHFAGYGQKVVV